MAGKGLGTGEGIWALVPWGTEGTLPTDWGVPDWRGDDLLTQIAGLGRASVLAPETAFARAMVAYAAARDEWNALAEAESGLAAEVYQDNLPARYEAMLAVYRLAREFHQACQLAGHAVEAPGHWPRLDSARPASW